jgi:hypothetical protein
LAIYQWLPATAGFGILIFIYAAQIKIKTLPLRIWPRPSICNTIEQLKNYLYTKTYTSNAKHFFL